MDKKKAVEKYLNRRARHFKRQCPYCNSSQGIIVPPTIEHGKKTISCRQCNKKWEEIYGWVEVFELRDIVLEQPEEKNHAV